MDVHPPKNSIDRYWSIPIYIYNPPKRVEQKNTTKLYNDGYGTTLHDSPMGRVNPSMTMKGTAHLVPKNIQNTNITSH